MDWLRDFNWTIPNIESTTTTAEQSEEDKKFAKFEKIFKRNRKIKDIYVKKELKPGLRPVKQKTRPIPYHLRNYEGKK